VKKAALLAVEKIAQKVMLSKICGF